MASINLLSHTAPQMTIQINTSGKLGVDLKIQDTEGADEAIVNEWAVTTRRVISEAELKCLANYVKINKCRAHVDHFDKILLGWNMRGEHEIEELRKKLSSGLADAKSEAILASRTSTSAAKPAAQQVEKPSQEGKRQRPRPALVETSSQEFAVLMDLLISNEKVENGTITIDELLTIHRIFSELLVILDGKWSASYEPSLQDVFGKKTLDDFLRFYNVSIEQFAPFTPHQGNMTKVLNYFVEDMKLKDWLMLTTQKGRDYLTARLSGYLYAFKNNSANQGKAKAKP